MSLRRCLPVPFLYSAEFTLNCTKGEVNLEIDEFASYCPPWWLTSVQPIPLSGSISSFLALWISWSPAKADGEARCEALVDGCGEVCLGRQVLVPLWKVSGVACHPSLSLRRLVCVCVCTYMCVWLCVIRTQLPPMSLSAQGDCSAQWCHRSSRSSSVGCWSGTQK